MPAERERETPSRLSYVTYFLQWVGFVFVVLNLAGIDIIGYNVELYIGIFLYLLHIAESMCCSKTSRYLRNVMSEQVFVQHVEKMQKAWPKMHFKIVCYHNETRTTTDHEGKTQTHTEKVVTHTADMHYPVGGFVDETLSAAQTMAMFHLLHDGTKDLDDVEAQEHVEKQKKKKRRLFMLVHFQIEFHAASEECEKHYRDTKENFYAANTRDQHQDRTERSYVDDQLDHVMVILSGGTSTTTERPWWMRQGVFFLSCCLLFSIPYRFYLFSQCQLTRWSIMKHFSPKPVESWQDPVPVKSRRKQNDAAARAFRALPRESAGSGPVEGGHGDSQQVVTPGQALEADLANDAEVSLDEVVPSYWKSRDLGEDFDIKVRLSSAEVEKFQQLIDHTYIKKATRDRKDGPMAERLVVTHVMRLEDKRLFQRYLGKRAQLAGLPRPKLVSHMEGSGEFKTAPFSFAADETSFLTAPGLNEAYLYHGSSPAGAMGIGEDGFDMSMVGKNVGTMFGGGAYFAEACSKSDEYATEDPSGAFSGKYALLLCRVLLGNTFRVTESNIPAIEAALATGNFQSVLGDREAAVGTYREFVVFDEAQIYPEYIIIYERRMEAAAGS